MKKYFFIMLVLMTYFNSSKTGDMDDFDLMTITLSTEGDFSSPRRTAPRRAVERRSKVNRLEEPVVFPDRDTDLTMVADPIPEKKTCDRCCYLCWYTDKAQETWGDVSISAMSAIGSAAITFAIFFCVLLNLGLIT